jgi:DNA-binding transcriptional MocR family regulator
MDQRPDDFRPPRLSATMVSQRLLVLDFIRQYIGRWSQSPSQGEIARALDIDGSKVRRAIRSLARDGLILRRPGTRGLMLPETEAEAIRQLRALGWTVDPSGETALKATLLPPAALDYAEDADEGAPDDGTGDGPGGPR